MVNNIVEDPNQFEHLLHYNSTFCPGCHMICVSMMKRANPKMDIFEEKRGQNFQMPLPIYYFFPRYYIDECLYNYVVYEKACLEEMRL